MLIVPHPHKVLVPAVKVKCNIPLLLSPPSLRWPLCIQHSCQCGMRFWVASQIQLQLVQLCESLAGAALLQASGKCNQRDM